MQVTVLLGRCRRGLRGRAALASAAALMAMTAVLAIGGLPVQAALTPRPDATSPRTTAPPAYLNGVSAVSLKAAWAVGCTSYDNCGDTVGGGPLIELWNGTIWARAKGSFPSGLTAAELDGVSADTADDVWAVGDYTSSSGNNVPLVLHRIGTGWKQVASPLPSRASTGYSIGVSAVSASDAWAVGWYENGSGVQVSLVLHCTSTICKPVKSPLPNGATAANLFGVSAIPSTTAALTTGDYTTSSGAEFPLVLHCTSTACQPVKSTLPSGAKGGRLNGVSAVSANDTWVAGWYENGSGKQVPLVLHCTRTACTPVTSHAPNGAPDADLTGVSAVPATTGALATGDYTTSSGSEFPLVLHCTGTTCQPVKSTMPSGGRIAQLQAVSAVSAKDAWAVGVYKQSSDQPYAMILHCTSTACKPVKTPGGP